MQGNLRYSYQKLLRSEALQPDPAQQEIVNRLAELEDQLGVAGNKPRFSLFKRKASGPRGVYLWGGVGRGKSMLMDMLVEGLVSRFGAGAIIRIHFHELMQKVHNALNTRREDQGSDALKEFGARFSAGRKLIALDEMQITHITDAMIVGRLFETLFESGVTIVVTSNRPPQDLYKNGLNRHRFLPFIQLLEEQLDILVLDADQDYRRNRLKGKQLYFHPLDELARESMNRVWTEITNGKNEPLTLHIKGRELELSRFWAGAARASFFDLCGKPLGAADYLEITQYVKLLMLDEVPSLSRHNYNEARRFITLIDALYEARTRLVLSAADRPEMLYREGAGQFEFDRTVSRLYEMQSEGWGS